MGHQHVGGIADQRRGGAVVGPHQTPDVGGGDATAELRRLAAQAQQAINAKRADPALSGWGQQTAELQAGPGGGFWQAWEGGSIYWLPSTGAREVHGAIREHYVALGAERGLLGYPATDETGTPDGVGRFNHFERGSIYFHPRTGAFEIHGAIRDKWASQGWERFGYPICDEVDTVERTGRVNHFRVIAPGASNDGEERSIYWAPDLDAHSIQGPIRERWRALGWETGFLGYPVSDQYDRDGGLRNDFQYGSVVWSAASGVQVRPQWFTVDAPSIAFGAGIAVGGYGRLTVFSDGTTHFQGHLHASGFPSYDCLAVFTVKDADGRAYAASHTGRVHGTDEPGSRDFDWDEWGTNDDLRRNWPRISSGGVGGWKVDVTSDWSFQKIQKIVEDVVAAAGVVLAIIALIPSGGGGGGGDKSSDPNYGRPEAYPPGGLPPPDQSVGAPPG
jgi:hypothetical protein